MLLLLLLLAAIPAALAQTEVFPQGCTVAGIRGGAAAAADVISGAGRCTRSSAFSSLAGADRWAVISSGCTSSVTLTLFSDSACTLQVGSPAAIPVSSTQFYGPAPLASTGGLFAQALTCSYVSIAFATACNPYASTTTCVDCASGWSTKWCGGAAQACYSYMASRQSLRVVRALE